MSRYDDQLQLAFFSSVNRGNILSVLLYLFHPDFCLNDRNIEGDHALHIAN